jgi:hypothetical protein
MTSTENHESASDIEREAEASRARLAMTLDQLRDNLTPRHIADEVMGNARHGASAVLKSLGETAAHNPIPALLVSAACALFFSSGKLFAGSHAPARSAYVPAPTDYSASAYAGDKPAQRAERDLAPVAERRGSALGERPLVTAIVGLVAGASLAGMFSRAEGK